MGGIGWFESRGVRTHPTLTICIGTVRSWTSVRRFLAADGRGFALNNHFVGVTNGVAIRSSSIISLNGRPLCATRGVSISGDALNGCGVRGLRGVVDR